MLSINQNINLPERVVILGAGGFISNALEELLLKSKINFIAYKNDTSLLMESISAGISEFNK